MLRGKLNSSCGQLTFDCVRRLPIRAFRRFHQPEVPTMTPNEISGQIVDAAIRVHSALGPGLLEGAFEGCLTYELSTRGLQTLRQVPLPVVYCEVRIDAGFRIDMLVEDIVIVELKSVAEILPLHEAQLLTYLKLSGKRLGLLINFNVPHLKDGIQRMVNNL
jgi:GxxExxY protein